jgi:diguanylate cyclase (GGDEF)-like protein
VADKYAAARSSEKYTQVSSATSEDSPLFLSTLPAGQGERRVALAVVLASVAVFIVTAPFAKLPLPAVPTFIAIYESALVINDLITAVFLFGQFNVLRSRALLLLANGYLFSAFVAVAHALTFPGLFSPAGLLGAGPQTTAWLYVFWHTGFPLLVIAYTLVKQQRYDKKPCGRAVIPLSVGATFVAACGLTLVATTGRDILPAIMLGSHYTPAIIVVVWSMWILSFAALVALWQRRPHSVLDMWLMVVLCAWVCDIGLSAVFNAGRFDLGFYAGRVYGLLATSFVLIMLVVENSRLYSRLIETHESDRQKAAELQRLTTVDALTGIGNRRAFETALDLEWRRAMRHKTPLCLLMIDVDFFKRYNDAYGHLAGDDCLRSIAKVLADNSRRAGELAARYGGEEFAVLLPKVDLDDALRVGRRVCEGVRELNIPNQSSTTATHVTISAGVASASLALGVKSGKAPTSAHSARRRYASSGPSGLVALADEALYGAKTGGRNRAFVAQQDDLVAAKVQQSAA